MLSKIEALVQSNFYDPNFNGRNWKQLVAQYHDRIVDSPSLETFEEAVRALLSELQSSAMWLLSANTKIAARSSIAASFRRIQSAPEGDRWAFQDVQPGGVAALAGIKPADVLVSIEGMTITPPDEPSFAMNSETPVIISRNGERKEIRLVLKTPRPKYRENPYTEPESAVATVMPGAIGYLKVTLFPGQVGVDFANHLDIVFERTLRDCERLIVDLRGNPGGGIGGVRLMSYFTPDRQPIGYSRDRKCLERQCDPQKLPRFGGIPKLKWQLPLLAIKYAGKRSVVVQTEGRGPRGFHGKIVLLVNEHSSGAAEMVTQFAKENRLATSVGMQTSGRLAARSAFKIGFGYRLTIPVGAYVSWGGQIIEGQGVQPDIPIDWSFQEEILGRDVQLERALEVARAL